MKTPSVLLLAGLLVVAGGAALLARALLATPPAPVMVQQVAPPAVETAPAQAILVASRPLQPGEFIDTASVEWQTVEGEHSPLIYFLRDQDSVNTVLGATVRQPIAKGQPLVNNLVVRPGEPGFVATVLKPGMRAIAVPTNAVASSSGLFAAGDRVDVILSLGRAQESSGAAGAGAEALPRLAAQTLLRDVRVLALNNVTRSELILSERPNEQTDRNNLRRGTEFYETVTLEVPAHQTERLALAREVGTLQLALRGAGEPSTGQPVPGNRNALALRDATSIYNTLGRPVHTYQGKDVQVVKVNR